MLFRRLFPLGLLPVVFLVACSQEPESSPAEAAASPVPGASPVAVTVFDDSVLGDQVDGRNWAAFGRTYSEQRFSPLDTINTEPVTRLGLDWFLDLPNARGLVGTPLVADGIMYFNESMNRVHAVDLHTRERLWSYDPRVAEETGTDLRVGWEHNRGTGLWKDKIYLATWDGRLIAVDLETGRTVEIEGQRYEDGGPVRVAPSA